MFLSLDGDLTIKEIRANIKKLLNSGFIVRYIRLPDKKDPDDLKEDYKKYVDNPVDPYFLSESFYGT